MQQNSPNRPPAPDQLRMCIGGDWVEAEDGGRFDAVNPATGEVFATLALGTRNDARAAIAAARAAQPVLARLSVWDRSRLCLAIADVMAARQDDLARTLSEDQGKPFRTEARFEIAKAIEGFRNAAEHVKWLTGESIPVEDPGKRVFTLRQPRGVYAVITPWNFPFNIPIEYLAPGLAAGNAIVWVPAPTTSVCAVRLMECIEQAGVPPGAVNLVTGEGPVVGDEIAGHPGTDAVGFTGSALTGVAIARRAAGKPLLLEMGGNGPVVVLDDADLEAAARATAVGCFVNAGQVCSSSERVLVSATVHDAFADRMVGAAEEVLVGDPFGADTTMGPLNNDAVAAKVVRHVADGVERGGRVLFGGGTRRDLGSALFFEPTVLTDLPLDCLLNREETFGPVVPLIRVERDDDIIDIANRNALGLVASVFTRDLARAFRVAEGIRTGIVNVNDTSNYWELHIPFGGMSGKRSGIGRLGGAHTLKEMTDLKTICLDVG